MRNDSYNIAVVLLTGASLFVGTSVVYAKKSAQSALVPSPVSGSSQPHATSVSPSASPTAASTAYDVPAQGFEKSVLILSVSKRDIDIDSPWRFKDSTSEQHLGIALANGKVLTTAFAVLNSTLIEVRRFGRPTKAAMKVDFVDYECNLALVSPAGQDATAVIADMVPFKVGQDMSVSNEAWILNERNGTQLIRNAARIVEVNVVNATTSALSLPSYMMKAQQTGLGWSEPVVRGQELVGITTGQDENHVYAIPASVIQHFIADALSPESAGYKGFPGLGFEVRPLVDPNLRKLLKGNGVSGGVYITSIFQGATAEPLLKVRDVVLEIDGTSIGEDGTFRHPDWGRLSLLGLISKKFAGDIVKLKILREGIVQEIAFPLTRFESNSSLFVFDRYDGKESHVIFGGLIFQELSRDYLREWGREWRSVAPLDLLYLWEVKNKPTSDKSRKLILNRVLADEYNQGYDRLQNLTLDKVNGIEVHSIEQLRDALQKPVSISGKQYAVFLFDQAGGEVILGYDRADDAQMRIAKTYSINSPNSFYFTH